MNGVKPTGSDLNLQPIAGATPAARQQSSGTNGDGYQGREIQALSRIGVYEGRTAVGVADGRTAPQRKFSAQIEFLVVGFIAGVIACVLLVLAREVLRDLVAACKRRLRSANQPDVNWSALRHSCNMFNNSALRAFRHESSRLQQRIKDIASAMRLIPTLVTRYDLAVNHARNLELNVEHLLWHDGELQPKAVEPELQEYAARARKDPFVIQPTARLTAPAGCERN